MLKFTIIILCTTICNFYSQLHAQVDNIDMSSGTTAVNCANTTNFYDNGGPSGNATNTNITHTFTSSTCVQVTFSPIDFGNSGATLSILDSDGTTVLGTITKNNDGSGISFTSTGTQFTFDYSGGGGNYSGWAATISCVTGDATFSLSATCSSATSSINGDTGGTFSFNSAPGDGATINSATGEVSNVTPNTTYSVLYTNPCGGTSVESVTIPFGDATFSLTETCNGATALVSGDSGGVFTFNPAPGDGATIDSNTGQVTNGVTGSTYTIEYSVCANSSTVNLTANNNNCFTMLDDATTYVVDGENCVQLTAAQNDQTGCAWSGESIDFSNNFTLTLDYYFGNNPGGADGTTFAFTPNPGSCGSNGAQLGAGGLSNTLIIEFDTYDNDGSSSNDLSCDHIAIEIDGDLPDDPSNFPSNDPPLAGPICANSDASSIEDGSTHDITINWDAATQTLGVYFDGNLRLSCTNDFITNVFGGQSEIFWGATGATGGFNNQQYFCPSTVVVLPTEIEVFQSDCENENETVFWSTSSEDRLNYFVLEYTYDNLVFYPEETISAVGHSQEPQHYSVSIEENSFKPKYYRLKSVDHNGEFKTTGLIAGKNCSSEIGLINSTSSFDGKLIINVTENCNLSIVNMLGQILYENRSTDLTLEVDHSLLSNGIFFVIATKENGISESRKIRVDK